MLIAQSHYDDSHRHATAPCPAHALFTHDQAQCPVQCLHVFVEANIKINLSVVER